MRFLLFLLLSVCYLTVKAERIELAWVVDPPILIGTEQFQIFNLTTDYVPNRRHLGVDGLTGTTTAQRPINGSCFMVTSTNYFCTFFTSISIFNASIHIVEVGETAGSIGIVGADGKVIPESTRILKLYYKTPAI